MALTTDFINIETHTRTTAQEYTFSIFLPTWNNLEYLKLCISSIRKNSSFTHQIIVHVNEGTDGSLEWIKNQPDIDYSYSEKNVGVCYALNSCRTLAAANYILYINDDMYVCPGWDVALYDEIKKIGHKYFFLSTTAIEPKIQSNCAIEKDYGKDVQSFNEEKLLQEFQSFEKEDWQGATWPPNVVHKSIWDLVGGYSIEFSPGLLSDPDFSAKLWKFGVRYFKGISRSRVYHFGSVSLKRIKRNNGYYMFVAKWQITQNTFSKNYLHRGEAFIENLQQPELSFFIKVKNAFKKFKAVFFKY